MNTINIILKLLFASIVFTLLKSILVNKYDNGAKIIGAYAKCLHIDIKRHDITNNIVCLADIFFV